MCGRITGCDHHMQRFATSACTNTRWTLFTKLEFTFSPKKQRFFARMHAAGYSGFLFGACPTVFFAFEVVHMHILGQLPKNGHHINALAGSSEKAESMPSALQKGSRPHARSNPTSKTDERPPHARTWPTKKTERPPAHACQTSKKRGRFFLGERRVRTYVDISHFLLRPTSKCV